MFDLNRPRKLLTICIVREPGRVLLGMKKRGFGVGRFNGFGGKLNPGETVEEAAIRELEEEANIKALDLERMGVIYFEFKDQAEILETHIFKVEKFSGEIVESEEMRPQWFSLDEIPYQEMWPDDIYWLPLFLENKHFKGRVSFDENNQIVDRLIEEHSNL